jgi:hypothetical protein
MFSIFKRNPTKNQFITIIQNLKNILINKYPRYTGIDVKTVNDYYIKWINEDNKEKVIENFEEIIEHIYIISTNSITQESINIYLQILDIYNEKINIIYGFS